jgi:transposase
VLCYAWVCGIIFTEKVEMFLVQIPNKKTGRTFLQISESIRIKEEGQEKSKSVQRVVMPIGYLDELLEEYEDPVAHFKEVAKQMTTDKKNLKDSRTIKLKPNAKLKKAETLDATDTRRKNIGYAAFSALYHQLEIDYFIDNRRRYKKVDANLNTIFKLLVFARLLWPSSKYGSWEKRGRLFEECDFKLSIVYRSLDYFLQWREPLLKHLYNQVQKHYGRDTFLFYYDVTNYYFEVDESGTANELRQKGVNKEHRPNPIVQMGLLMDEQGLPVTYELWQGNVNDCTTLPQMLDGTILDLGLHHRIVVADKGMMSGDNVARILLAHNGYVISDSLRGSTKSMKDWALKDDLKDGFVKSYDKDGKIIFMHKERYHPRIISVTTKDGKKENVQINERQVVIYSAKYAARAKVQRQKALEKAETRVMSMSKDAKASNYGSAKYIKKVPLNEDTGELEMDRRYITLLDEKRIAEEELLDGYYLIRTNVIGLRKDEALMKQRCQFTDDGFLKLNRSVTELDILEMYRGLWKIEETFKVTKSLLKARPVYVSTESHIRSHFLICFVSLLLMRILEHRMEWKHSAAEIQRTLRAASGTKAGDNLYIFDHYDEVLQDIGKNLGIDFSRESLTIGEIRSLMAATKK